MKKIHVFHLIDGLTFGGAETLLRDLAAGLEKRGYEITVAYSTHGAFVQELENKGIKLKHIPRLGLIDPIFLLRIFAILRQSKPDVVHTHLFKSDFHGRLAARLAGVPVVVSTLHNNDVWANNKILGYIYGLTALWVDRLIAVSPEVKDFHIQKTFVSPEKITVIQNGVDVEAFSGHNNDAQQARKDFGFTSTQPVFGIIGRLMPQKNVSMFLHAAVEILRSQPDARFLIVGDGELRTKLEAQAKDLGLLPSVIFTGMRKDIPIILNAIDVLVLSSLWEGLPVILLEAMAASRPVVSTAVDGVLGVVEPDVTAILTPKEDASALAKACIKLARDSELRKKMGYQGHQRVLKSYSLSYMIDCIAKLYQELLSLKNKHISTHSPDKVDGKAKE